MNSSLSQYLTPSNEEKGKWRSTIWRLQILSWTAPHCRYKYLDFGITSAFYCHSKGIKSSPANHWRKGRPILIGRGQRTLIIIWVPSAECIILLSFPKDRDWNSQSIFSKFLYRDESILNYTRWWNYHGNLYITEIRKKMKWTVYSDRSIWL